VFIFAATPKPALTQASPHPQPLSQAWERGARGEQENPVPLLPCNKSEASAVIPPLVGGNEGGWEKGLGDEGEMLASRAFHLKLTPMVAPTIQFIN